MVSIVPSTPQKPAAFSCTVKVDVEPPEVLEELDELLDELEELLELDEELDELELLLELLPLEPEIDPAEAIKVTLSSSDPSSLRKICSVCEPAERFVKVIGVKTPQPVVAVLFCVFHAPESSL